MKSLLKSALVWTLSFLIGVQPALAAQKAVNQDIKSFLEHTGVTQRSVTLREFYAKTAEFIPPVERRQIESFVNQFPEVKLPKMDVNKVTGPDGDEVYQIQAVQDGQSVSVTLVGTNEIFAKVNGKNLSVLDLMDMRKAFVKAGIPAQQADQMVDEKKAVNVAPMSAARVAKMSVSQRKQYMKNFRQLLESIEATQNSGLGIKKSAKAESKFDFFAQLLMGEVADASGSDTGKECIAAGYNAVVVWNKNRPGGPGDTCGSDGAGGVAPAFRGNCARTEYQCNPVVFGDKAGCIAASRETTADCSAKVQARTVAGNDGLDIPDSAADKKKFDDLKKAAVEQAEKLQAICKATSYSKSGLTQDQKYTCQNLDNRLAEIQSWDCNDTNYAKHKNLEKICKTPVPGEPTTPTQPVEPGQPGQPGTNPVNPGDGIIWCNDLPLNMTEETGHQVTCENGTTRNKSCSVKGADGRPDAKQATLCECYPGGSIVGKMKCSPGTDQAAATAGKDEKDKRKSKGLFKMAAWVIGIAALSWYVIKKAFKTSYQNINPDTINPPITVPTITTPSTLPPPIPAASRTAQ